MARYLRVQGTEYVKVIAIPIIIITLSIMFFLPLDVSADVGPKPSLSIIVENAPEGEYYLDLLIDYEHDHLYTAVNRDDVAFTQMYDVLKDYNDNGWRPALITGTRVPLNGSLSGINTGNKMVHQFSYVGVPDRFKVIIVTQDLEIIVSDNIIDRKAFNSTVHFDSRTGKLSESFMLLAYLKQFLTTCTATLLIESLILIIFGFAVKQNWKPFFIINICTQLLLTFIIFGTMYSHGSFAAVLLYIPFELIILTTETLLFIKYLHRHSKLRRALYAITANLVSFAFGLFIMISYPSSLHLLKSWLTPQ